MTKVYKSPECQYVVEDTCIKTDCTVKHKVTGTMMAGILGISPWSTPFQVACNLLGLGREEIGSKPSVKTGQKLEPVIIKYVADRYSEKGLFLSAEEVFEKRKGDHDAWASDFESDIFAGHVDGLVMHPDGTETILEIKTSSNLDSWLNGVPEYYYWQVALYNHFMTKKDHAYVVLGMVDQDTHKNPQSWIPSDRTVQMYKMDIDTDDVAEKLEEVEQWYRDYILAGVTPAPDMENEGDRALYEHLKYLAEDVDSVRDDVKRLFTIKAEIKAGESEMGILYSDEKELSARIKNYMIEHNLSSILNDSIEAKISTKENVSYDMEAMADDGIDIEKYKTVSETKTFTVKSKKKETKI